MRIFPIILLVIAIIVVGIAAAVGIGYQKTNDDGINGSINIITSQAIGVDSITFDAWPEEDDSGIGVVAEDGLSYIIGLQLNNGDEYGSHAENQGIKITLKSYSKTVMVVKLTTEFSITKPDPADSASNDIHIWYTGGQEDVIGQIDPWSYLVRIPAMPSGSDPSKVDFWMHVDVGNTVEPGFYSFETFIEPTNWHSFDTINMA